MVGNGHNIYWGSISVRQEGGPVTMDEWFFGRYAEGVLLPLIAIGLISIRNSKPIIFSAFFIAWTGWALLEHAKSLSPNFVNIQGFCRQRYFPISLFLFGSQWEPLLWSSLKDFFCVTEFILSLRRIC